LIRSGNKIFKWIKIIVVIYCLVGIALYYLQEKFLFHPQELPADHKFSFDQRFEELNVVMNATDSINVVKFLPDSPARGAVIYFHGNRQNIERYAGFAKSFTRKGYEVWMPDYPGFGKSRGSRSEKDLYRQAYQVYNMVRSRFSQGQIIIYGKSFGTGLASYLASEVDCRMLILETPYNSITGLFSFYAPVYPVNAMSNYKLPTDKFLEYIKEPVIIFHGDDDGVIPLRNASTLRLKLKSGDQFNVISGGEHNNLATFDIYKRKIDSLLN